MVRLRSIVDESVTWRRGALCLHTRRVMHLTAYCRFKKYQLKKKKKRNIQVTHVKTKAEVEEEKAAARMANHQPVFPFMRMTNIVRQQDGRFSAAVIAILWGSSCC